jgi:hypothetical protein
MIYSQTIIEENLPNDINFISKITKSKGIMVGSAYMKNFEFQPFVIDQDETFSVACEVKVEGIKSIILNWNQGYIFLHNNNPADSIVLFDNGQNGDLLANDKTFTANNLRRNPASSIIKNTGSAFIGFCEIKYLFENGGIAAEIIDFACGIRFIDIQKIEIPEVLRINDTIQYSSHVVNYVMNLGWDQSLSDYYLQYSRNKEIALKTFYHYFQDDRDFFSICSTYPSPYAPAGQYSQVRNNVIGIEECTDNICIYDNSYLYGSKGFNDGLN